MTRSSEPSALLLEGGDSPHLISAVRALTAAGWRVGLGGRSAASRVARSRHVRLVHPVPPLEQGIAGLIAGINAAAATGRYDLVFPGDDAELLALSQVRDQLRMRFPYPPHGVVVRAVDKLALTTLAAQVGLAVPHTVQASESALRRVRPPVVVKPALHWSTHPGQLTRHLPVRLCIDEAEVRAVVEEISAAGGCAVLQEPVAGELMALTVVAGPNGEPLTAIQQRTSMLSLRGNSARAETVQLDPLLHRQVRDLLAALGWVGLANLQFLRPADGRPRLIDFNARFYGSMALTRAAGVNVPAIWARSALGEPMPATLTTGRPGARWQTLEEDLQRARVQRRGGLVRDVASSLAYAPGAAHPAWALTDPVPGLVSAARMVRSIVTAGTKATVFRSGRG